ncbi:MAG: NTP transferase domain-containing protein [Acidobacteriota bacterium]
MQQYDVIILAGGVNSGKLSKFAPYDSEALIIIGNYPMIYYVLEAVKASQRIRNIIISGPQDSLKELLKKEDGLCFAQSGTDAVESFVNALASVGKENLTEKVLIIPTDIPFITAEAIDDFVQQCENNEADVHYSVVNKDVVQAGYPGIIRTYFKTRHGVFTGGNVVLLRLSIIDKCIEMAHFLVANRKNTLAIAKFFGLGMLWKLISGRLTFSDAEQRFNEMSGIKGKAIISNYPEVGVDVDKPSDLKLAEQFLGNTKPTGC